MPTYIYALIDPRDETVRYIGKTVDPRNRLQKHRATGHSEVIKTWATELEIQGLKVGMQILETVEDGDDWRIVESYWVRYALAQHWPILNKVAGGDGVPLHFIAARNPELNIYRCIRVAEPTATLLSSVMWSKSSKWFLHTALYLLHYNDQLNSEAYLAKLQTLNWTNLPVWPPNRYLADGRLNLIATPDLKSGLYCMAVPMRKKTGDLLDELAAKIINGKRRGYDSTWYTAITLLKEVYDKNKSNLSSSVWDKIKGLIQR